MVDEALRTFGSIYGLVNNAGIETSADLTATPAHEWDRILAVNLRSVFLCSRAAIPHMRKAGRGSIVHIASVHANFGFERASAYDASQADPEQIERETQEWHPLRRRGRPLDIARAVRFLLSDEAEWITGASLVVDGGLSVRFFGSDPLCGDSSVILKSAGYPLVEDALADGSESDPLQLASPIVADHYCSRSLK